MILKQKKKYDKDKDDILEKKCLYFEDDEEENIDGFFI